MKYKRKNQAEAIIQILVLVIGIIAISWMIGSEVKVVGASDIEYKCDGNSLKTYVDGKLSKTQICPGGGKCEYTSGGAACEEIDGGVKKVPISNLVTNAYLTKEFVEDVKNILAPKPTGPPLGSPEAEQVIEETLKAASKSAYSLHEFLFGKQITKTAAGETGWSGVGGGSSVGSIGAIAVWSAIAFVVGRYVLGPMFGLSTRQSQALGWSLAGGTAAGLTATSQAILPGAAVGGPVGILIGIGVAFFMFAILAKKSSVDVIQPTCYQWDSQSGKRLTELQRKQRCEMCNEQELLKCTEYQCRSLGQGCMLINEEDSGRQLCIWNNTKDITPPIIEPWKDALLDNFTYAPDNRIFPPDRGVKIVYTGKTQVTIVEGMRCAPPFTPVSFGVQLDEAAKCKISPVKTSSYATMADRFMGRGISEDYQSFVLSLPSKEAKEAENITVDDGGKYELYVRCEDANGNANIANFVFKFCISEGPDRTPPEILGTSILDNEPIGSGQSSINLSLYLRDQTFTKANASCRWSHLNKNYNSMEENMSCTHTIINSNAQLGYTCSANLTRLKDNQNNRFYFRCVDDIGNANTQPYVLNLIGTRPLIIDEVGPKGIIQDSTDFIKVELTAKTSAGYQEGKAICSFSETGTSGSYVEFFYGYEIEPFSQHEHTQELGRGEGNYTYYIRCKDRGGNIDDANVSFSVKIDKQSPIVVRIYKEDDYLKLITDEPARCVYANFGSCSYLFDEGTDFIPLDDKEHYTEWNINADLYIKCEDEYGNQPKPPNCSIIARPFEIPELI